MYVSKCSVKYDKKYPITKWIALDLHLKWNVSSYKEYIQELQVLSHFFLNKFVYAFN